MQFRQIEGLTRLMEANAGPAELTVRSRQIEITDSDAA